MICRIVSLAAVLLAANTTKAEFVIAKAIPLDASEIPVDLEPPRMVGGDLNGDGKIDWVFTHGTRLVRAYDHDGKKLWTYALDKGEHCPQMYRQPNSVVWDMDGDGKDEVMCTLRTLGASTYDLIMLDGLSGKVKYSRTIPYQRKGAHLAVAYMTDQPYLILKVDENNRVERWPSETSGEADGAAMAFDQRLNLLWRTECPNGGHYYWPYDVHGDGFHELIAGKYIIDARGKIIQTMNIGSDHADSLICADIDPNHPGKEVCIAGATGIRLFNVHTNSEIWRLGPEHTPDPQWIFGGQFDPDLPGLELEAWPRHTEADTRLRVFDHKGNILYLLENAHAGWFLFDYDGDRSRDELLALSGEVRDHTGRVINDTSWIPPGKFARWGLARDVIGDEREEYITWSHNRLIIGSNNASFVAGSIPSFRTNREYRLRAVNNSFRGTILFDYRTGQ